MPQSKNKVTINLYRNMQFLKCKATIFINLMEQIMILQLEICTHGSLLLVYDAQKQLPLHIVTLTYSFFYNFWSALFSYSYSPGFWHTCLNQLNLICHYIPGHYYLNTWDFGLLVITIASFVTCHSIVRHLQPSTYKLLDLTTLPCLYYRIQRAHSSTQHSYFSTLKRLASAPLVISSSRAMAKVKSSHSYCICINYQIS